MKNNQSSFCPIHRVKFFRVLLPGFSRKLSLPRAVTKYFIQENNTRATLLSPLGKSWHVGLCRDGESTLNFEEGWEKFAEDHKLAMGDFLVFKHKGNLVFDVTIFDPTTCERQYHSTSVGLTCRSATNDKIPGQEEAPKEKEFSNNSEEASKGFRRQRTSSSCGKRAAEPMESAVTSMKRRSIDVEEYLKEQSDHNPKEPDVMKDSPRGPQFETVIRHHRKSRYSLEIPAAFEASNELSTVSRLFLKDPKGVVWTTNVSHALCAGSRIRSRIYRGWRNFCAANDLEDGDTCVFELREKNMLHVQVRKKVMSLQTYRRKKVRPMKAPQDASMKNKNSLSEPNTADVIEPPTRCQAKLQVVATVQDHMPLPYRGFTSKITPSEAGRGYLRIPRNFSLSFADLSTVRKITIVDGQSRRWSANVLHSKESSHLGLGWVAFCRCNNVEAGDVCIFKLTSMERDLVFQVEVIKAFSHPRIL